MLLIENIKLAINAIKINKMRSFLTMLGIIIGISSVIAISSIGSSAQGAIEDQFESVGAGYMYLMPNWYTVDEITENMYFTWDEIEVLKSVFRMISCMLHRMPTNRRKQESGEWTRRFPSWVSVLITMSFLRIYRLFTAACSIKTMLTAPVPILLSR